MVWWALSPFFLLRCPVDSVYLEALLRRAINWQSPLALRAGSTFIAVASSFPSSVAWTESSKAHLCSGSLSVCLQEWVLLQHFICGFLRGEAERKAGKWIKTATVEAKWLKKEQKLQRLAQAFPAKAPFANCWWPHFAPLQNGVTLLISVHCCLLLEFCMWTDSNL